MGTREWLLVLVTVASACDGTEIGAAPHADPPRSLGSGGAASAGGVAGADPRNGTGTGAGGVAGADPGTGAGGVASADPGTDPGIGGVAGTGGVAGSGPCGAGPRAAPIPGCDPLHAASTGDVHADCVDRINQFRWECQCLPPLERWADGESCADGNAQYDSLNGVHASFSDMPCGSGARAQNECPGWASNDHVIGGCLRAMWDEGPEDGDPDTVNGHYESMASTTYSRVACGFYATPAGEVWGVQNFD